MKKLKKKKIGSYFRELSIVIIGVAVTLYANNLINSINEKKDVKLRLNAVYAELEDNLHRVEQLIDFYERACRLRDFLWDYHDHPEMDVSEETFRQYNAIINDGYSFFYRKGAYDLFMTNGTMTLFDNKQLILDITECYEFMEETKSEHDYFLQLRLEQFKSLYQHDLNYITGNHKITDPRVRNIYNFYMLTIGEQSDIQTLKERIENILSKKSSNRS